MSADTPHTFGGYCCAAKYYYSQNNTLVHTLQITPRVVICKKRLKVNHSYEQIVTIRNTGVYPRRLQYHTDSDVDTRYRIYGGMENKYLDPDSMLQIKIIIDPVTAQGINRTRNFFVTAEHPNITFEIPIIVMAKDACFPEAIIFPQGVPGTDTYYEFPIYNPTAKNMPLTLKSTYRKLDMTVSGKYIPKKDYARVLLKLSVKNQRYSADTIKIKAGNSAYLNMKWVHNPIATLLYINLSQLYFEELVFNREAKKHLLLCNESENKLQYQVQFLTEQYEHDRLALQSDNETEDEVVLPSPQSADASNSPRSPFSSIGVESGDVVSAKHHKYFQIEHRSGGWVIPANSSSTFTVIFQPKMDHDDYFDDKEHPPYTLTTKLFFSVLNKDQREVLVRGLVRGPEVEFWPSEIDLRSVYMGEEHCETITARNIDKLVDAVVEFKGFVGEALGHATVKPVRSQVLAVCEQTKFLVNVYSRIIGKFQLKLLFKIKNGNAVNIVVRGLSSQVRMKSFPDMIELGSVPVAIPQKRLVLLVNPLSVPVCVQCVPADDGEETPLVLSVRAVDDLLPVTIKDFVKKIPEKDDEYGSEEQICDLFSPTLSESSYHSVTDDHTSFSTNFENEVLWDVPELARAVVHKIKSTKIPQMPSAEERTIQEALHELLKCNYFSELKEHQNYAYVDWNALPNDPKEIYCGTEIFYLAPNTGRSVTVMIIPNKLGYHNRSLEIRCCPIVQTDKSMTPDQNALVKTELMSYKIWIEYNCRVPEVIWDDEIIFDYTTIYCGQKYEFDMEFGNKSNIGGFIFYDIIPDSEEGVMWFRDDRWKFFISPYGSEFSVCCVMFRRFGYRIRLPGLLKFVGQTSGMPFYLIANVLPTCVHVEPKAIFRRQFVLETSYIYIYIDNATPTATWLTLYLKYENEKYQTVYPRGNILNPYGQGMFVELKTKYYDPEVYKNILTVNLPYGRSIEVPITFSIEGMPVFFEPNIKDGFDTGHILTSSEADFYAGVTNYASYIRVINRGERIYRLVIRKLRRGEHKCAATNVRAHLTVSTKTFLLQPGLDEFIHITAYACDPVTIYDEFRLQIIDTVNPQRILNARFTVTAKFIVPELHWNRKEVCFNYYRTHKLKEHSQFELVQLRNIASVLVESVHLNILGPFKMKEQFEDKLTKELQIAFKPLETKEFTIELNKKPIQNQRCTFLANGRLQCTANGMGQRTLPLRVNIFNPELKIAETEVVLFKKHKESEYIVEIENSGCLDAQYKWKKLLEEMNFVGPVDDVSDFAQELLSDVMLRLALSEDGDDSELESLYERNLSLHYQKYRHKFQPQEDLAGVGEILDEIIENLDLEHKRYVLKVADVERVLGPISAHDSHGNISVDSSKTCIYKAIDNMLDVLNLEDSYEISDASSSDYFMERTAYFFEKSGTLMQGEKAECRLHLPGLRNGYALTTTFQLDVVGGDSRTLNIALVNLENTVQLTKDNIYLGVMPWYELFKAKTHIFNVTEYKIKMQLAEIPHQPRNKRKCNRIADGYVKIRSPMFFTMPVFGILPVKLEGIVGFCEEFNREIRITVNDSDERCIRLRGQGIMPMLTGKMPRMEQEQSDIIEEYQLLRRVYYFDIFRGITEEDEEVPVGDEEDGIKTEGKESFTDISLLSTTSSSSNSSSLKKSTDDSISTHFSSARRAAERERRFFRLLQTYVLVNNNAELPDAMLLMQLVETEKFLESLSTNEDACAALQLVYQDYVKTLKSHDEKKPLNLRYFTTQPLPFNMNAYMLNMNELKLNEVRKFVIDLHFYGPGKLIASARTAVKIYGLAVDFEVPQPAGGDNQCTDKAREYLYYMNETKGPDFFDKRYRNIYEREIDLEKDVRLKHAHSFDRDEQLQHKRQPHVLTAKERKSVHNYYNSLTKSVYLERKHHLTLCKIFTNTKQNFSGTHLRVVLLFRPEAKFYEDDQLLEDYLYIDLHLGPTLPILLRGLIKGK